MKILEHIAQDIAEKTSEVLQFAISITDNEGYIIGSTDKSRIGLFHKPSLDVIKNDRMVDCKNEVEQKILPGISVPLKFNNNVIGVLGIVGEPREVEKYVQLVKNHVEMMCQEAFRKEMTDLKEKMIEVFVHQMIHYKENDDVDHIEQYAKMLEYELETNKVCILVDIHSLSQNISSDNPNQEPLTSSFPLQHFQREVLDFLHLLFHESKNDIISSLNIERFIIIKSLSTEHAFTLLKENLSEKLERLNTFLETKYNVSASMAVGDINSGIKGVAESYSNAKKALAIFSKSEQKNTVYFYNELETLFRLLPNELSNEYKNKLLKLVKPLIKQDNYEVLAHTFTAFCKYNMNMSVASRHLFIHRNTLIYRLEKINELTTLDTSNFEHCMLLYTAIQCYEESKK
ncbi:CdaR family transcriptional regulator [Bacillus litorisediminis]|uniref:CdaR family transcriptional regulator n=1 Tax=Bacillus litorisediminis TaxID=2922713 RepID=UPI001FAD77A5|nr:sugar diacid recognition domain-containing protein [Bacillus litorisediminis]